MSPASSRPGRAGSPLVFAASLLVAAAVAGCAAPVRSSNQTVEIVTEPAGAVADLSDGTVCTTPCAVTLPRETSQLVKMRAPNCDPLFAGIYPDYGPDANFFASYFTPDSYYLVPRAVRASLACRS
ncbi:MAG TPA: hypothetical protein VGD08_04565 [Stellaceae bacterium]